MHRKVTIDHRNDGRHEKQINRKSHKVAFYIANAMLIVVLGLVAAKLVNLIKEFGIFWIMSVFIGAAGSLGAG